jgi:hypothetical protein
MTQPTTNIASRSGAKSEVETSAISMALIPFLMMANFLTYLDRVKSGAFVTIAAYAISAL